MTQYCVKLYKRVACAVKNKSLSDKQVIYFAKWGLVLMGRMKS